MNNYQWLLQMDGAERQAWFDAEHVEHQERALDGDTDALERKSADLIHEYYRPMVSELQGQVFTLKAERDNLAADLLKANNERERYRSMCSDMATKIHDALMIVDEGMA